MGDGVLGPGDHANETIQEWCEKWHSYGRPSYGYACTNDFMAWLCYRLEASEQALQRIAEESASRKTTTTREGD